LWGSRNTKKRKLSKSESESSYPDKDPPLEISQSFEEYQEKPDFFKRAFAAKKQIKNSYI